MRSVLFSSLLLISAECTARAPNTACAETAQQFLASPTRARLAALQQAEQGSCWQSTFNASEDFLRLTSKVALGNDLAAEYLATHVRETDGGELEDSLISLGQYADRRMPRFMQFAADGLQSEWQFTRALEMLPTELTDQFAAQLNAMRQRRAAASKVSDRKLARLKRIAISTIDGRIAEIERVSSGLKRKEKL